ncbi:MAG: aminotransferase class V-fold PLP-dependent enzyme [Ignavibacteriaceae bacterium]|nr:aminotransferase class V-fold PLP-dependent enzyme [Ignavibacteriaceae bacterium]
MSELTIEKLKDRKPMSKKSEFQNSYQELNLDSENRSRLLTNASRMGIQFLDSLKDRRAFPSPDDLKKLKGFIEPIPEKPSDPELTMWMLNEIGSKGAIANAGGRYFGFVIGGSNPVSLAANWLAGAWDQNSGLEVTSPIGATLEKVCSGWLSEILPVSKNAVAGFVTGVTVANFCGLAAARHSILKKQGWDVQANGLFGAPPIKVVVSEDAHGSLLKALSLVGFGRERVIKVPVDQQGRMIVGKFPTDIDEKTIVCLQAGNVNTGAFDSAAEIIPIAKSKGAWVHVDGAFGLWAGASPDKSYLTEGYEFADSWATDAHKWLNVPYDSGIVLCSKPDALRTAMSMEGDYLDQSGTRIPYQYTPELSRRARAIEIWAALHSLGKKGIADLIDRTCRYAQKFADGIRKEGFDILNNVVINQVLVSFGSAEINEKIISEIQQDGTCWVGGSKWKGKTVMRISVSSWATTDEDVDKSLDVIVNIAKRISG